MVFYVAKLLAVAILHIMLSLLFIRVFIQKITFYQEQWRTKNRQLIFQLSVPIKKPSPLLHCLVRKQTHKQTTTKIDWSVVQAHLRRKLAVPFIDSV